MATSSSLELVLKLSGLQTRIFKRMDSQLGYHGLNFTEFLVLNQLKSAPDSVMRRIDLAESISMTASGITRMLAPMEKIGLIEKEANPRDARVSLVRLTSAGAQIFADAETTLNHAADSLTAKLDDSSQRKLLELVTSLL